MTPVIINKSAKTWIEKYTRQKKKKKTGIKI